MSCSQVIEGVTYPCEQCEFKAIYPSRLHHHVKSKHEEVAYACEHCEFKATGPNALKMHLRRKH